MKSKTTSLHPLLIMLAVALASVLFVVACGGGGEATEVSQVPEVAEEEQAVQVPEVAEEEQAAQVPEAVEEEQALAAEEDEFSELLEFEEEAVEVSEEAQAAAAEAEEGAPKRGGTLKVAFFPNFVTLDPHAAQYQGEAGVAISQANYDNLLMIQPDLSIKPELATHWEANEDLTSYTFYLREGVKFHHGKEFKAEDVVFSINRMMDPVVDPPTRTTFSVIDEVVVLDDYTIRFDLVAPNGLFPTYLSIYQARILPSDVDIDRLTLEEFGTGPFILEEHLPNERATLVRYEDYWDADNIYLDEIVILSIREAATRDAALKNGDVDVLWALTPQSVPEMEANPGTVALKATSFSWIGYYMDIRVPPFDNLLVRKAMQAATDREAINQAALLGLGTIASDHPIHPIHPVFASQYAPPDYDPELAKQLLAEAGYPDGIDITIHTADVGAGQIEMAVAFQQSAAPAGIRVEVQRDPSDAFWDVHWLVDPITTVYWNGRLPDQALTIQTHSDSSWNAPRYVNPRLDELIEKARGQDLEGQKESYGEIQKILIENVPRVVVAFQPWIYGARADVRGVEPHPLSWPIFQEGWFDR